MARAGRRELQPYQQGELDALCGVYAVVNLVRLVAAPYRRLTRSACWELFGELMAELGERGRLPAAVTEGCGTGQVVRLVARARRWLRDRYGLELRVERPFVGKDRRQQAGDLLLPMLARHLEEPARAVLLGLVEHWTVVRAVSDRRLRLFDSAGGVYLRCPAAEAVQGKRLGAIWLPALFLVGIKGE